MSNDDGWFGHVLDRVNRLPPAYFRELVVDIWGLRGFDIGLYDEGGADFVGFRGPRHDPETEVVALGGSSSEVEELADEAAEFDGARPVAVAKRFEEGIDDETGVEFVDSERIARLVVEGGFYWTFYRWVSLSEADEADIIEACDAPVRYGDDDDIVVGRATADRLGATDGDVIRVAREAAGRATRGGLLKRDRDYVEVGGSYAEGVDADKGDEVRVELVDGGEARRVYVLSVPSMEEELAAEVWKGHAPHRGTELSQPYGDDEIRTMALEVLPHDYCYVGEGTDVVVEGYAGARRVFD